MVFGCFLVVSVVVEWLKALVVFYGFWRFSVVLGGCWVVGGFLKVFYGFWWFSVVFCVFLWFLDSLWWLLCGFAGFRWYSVFLGGCLGEFQTLNHTNIIYTGQIYKSLTKYKWWQIKDNKAMVSLQPRFHLCENSQILASRCIFSINGRDH